MYVRNLVFLTMNFFTQRPLLPLMDLLMLQLEKSYVLVEQKKSNIYTIYLHIKLWDQN
jgi:hypothetical protein